MHNKIAQLILTPGSKASTTSEIFVAQPDSNKEELVGKLFVMIEIESKKVNDLKIINFLIENLNNNFYQSEKMILRERVKTVKVEHIFESALAKTNKNLADFLYSEKIKINPRLINATAGVIFENNLHFANIGKNKAFLIYKNKETKKYNITNIIKNAEVGEKKSQINVKKLFSNVISGSIPKYGYFIITNETLPEYISNKQMIEIITALPPNSAAEQIKNSLSKINYYVSFLGLIIKNTIGQEKKDIPGVIKTPTIEESVSNLNKVEDKTEELLTPGGIINFKKWFSFLSWINIKEKLFKQSGKKAGFGSLRDKIFFKKKTSLTLIKKIGSGIKSLLIYLVNLFVYIIKIITDKEKLLEFLEKIKSIPEKIKEKIQKFIAWFKNLNLRNKILFIVALASLLLFMQNLLVLSLKNKKHEEEKAYTDIITPIEQKQNQVEASFLYGNEDGARYLLEEIKGLMGELPRETDEQIEQYKTFEKKLNAQLEKIRHVVKIENLKELANFSNLNTVASPENIFLTTKNNKIFSGDSSQKTIYSLDLTDNLITAIAETNQEIKNLKYPAPSKGDEIYYFNGSSIVELNSKTEELNIVNLDISAVEKDIVASAGFNNRLYLLDKNKNQIYRYNKRPSGFTEEISWLNEKADLSDAVSISIDGHVYVLKKDGKLLKFLKGQAQEFDLDTIEPKLENASKVYISPELKFIYILEPAKKRLVIFDKTGDFLMQYQSDQFTDLKDFTVDESKKLIYFLNKSSIYEVWGIHFVE